MAASSAPLSAQRHKARHYALQALYQWHVSRTALSDIEAQFRVDFDMADTDLDYFRALLLGVPEHLAELDALLAPCLVDRAMHELTPIEMQVLRIGAFELGHRIDVPFKVVINEGVSLSKKFGAQDGHKFVNAVLDRLARKLRAAEVQSARGA